MVVTGAGAISSLGCSLETIATSLREGHSGICAKPSWGELGLKSQVAGDLESREDYAQRLARSRFSVRQFEVMGPVAGLCALATEDALAAAGLWSEGEPSPLVASRKFAAVVGSGVSSLSSIHHGALLAMAGKARRIRPHSILQGMSSTVSAHLVRYFGFGGRSYTISSACSTGSHSIGHAYELIRAGLIDRAIAGGGDEVGGITAAAFSALRAALSTGFNDTPEVASRPFDSQRDGFVLSGGAGVFVLESLASARDRGAEPLLEVLGFGANSDAHDMILPEPEGRSAADCMRAALSDAELDPRDIDYVNAHATGTIAGDIAEANALRQAFPDGVPPFSAPKSLTGHALGAAGSLEVIYSMLMMKHGFLAASQNVEELDPAVAGLDLVLETRTVESQVHLSNSFGFGGTNATLIVGAPPT